MDPFFKQASSKFYFFSQKYPQRPRYAALKMSWWSIRQSVLRCPYRPPSKAWYTLYTKYGRPISSSATNSHLPRIRKGHIYFNIDQALKCFPNTKRLGLVFFMGIGDYFYATNFIKILHETYPQLALDAYVSDQFDGNNSPLVATCMENNPNIEHIYFYHGKAHPKMWKDYDWSECYKKASSDTLLLPVIYEHENYVSSRTYTLCDTFGLPRPITNPKPLVYDYPTSPNIENFFQQYGPSLNKVVFLQCSNRSTQFVYPYHDELAQRLLNDGFFVVTVEDSSIVSPRLWKVDKKNMKITETIYLLQQLHKRKIPTYMISTFSCFNSISSALDIPNLSMQCFFDPAIGSVIYSNIFVLTPSLYPQILTDRQFVAPQGTYIHQNKRDVFSVDIVKKCFDQMLQLVTKDR